MAFDNPWTDDHPSGSDPAHQADDAIRRVRKDLSQRLKELFGITDFTADPLVPRSIGTKSLAPFGFRINDAVVWDINTSGNLLPTGDKNIGAATTVVKVIYAEKVESSNTGSITISSPTGSVIVRTGGANRWVVNDAGMFYPAVTAASDIGLTAFRPRDLYLSRDAYIAGSVITPIVKNAGNITINATTANSIKFATTDSVRWNINSTGHLIPEASVSFDIGASTNKVRDVFVGRHLTVDGQANSKWHAIGETSGAVTIDWNNSNVQFLVLNGDATIDFANAVTGSMLTLVIQQDVVGGRNITGWHAATRWGTGGVPVLSDAPTEFDVITFLFTGGYYLGFVNGYGFTA